MRITEEQWNEFVWDLYAAQKDFYDVYVMNRRLKEVNLSNHTFITHKNDEPDHIFLFEKSIEHVINVQQLYSNVRIETSLDRILTHNTYRKELKDDTL